MTDVEKRYKEAEEKRKAKIRQEPNKFKRACKWVWHWTSYPFVWIWENLRDWKTWLVFIIVTLAYSSSVWGFYLAALICGWESTTAGQWCIGIASSVWAWWLLPGSPFLIMCASTTMGVKAIFNKIRDSRQKRKEQQNETN